ncbi:hypothetical protein D3C85_1115240 [compost metagenome]
MIQGVTDQIVQQPLHRDPTQRERLDRLQAQTHPLLVLVERCRYFTHQITQVDGFHRFVTTIANERQELVENRVHVLDVAHHVVGQVAAVPHQFQRQTQAGQRCAQVVGDARQHQLALTPRLFDVLGHLIEGAIHLGHLTGCVADR